MKLSESVAFELHEQWRKPRLKEDGFYEPRWKAVKDAAFASNLAKTKELPSYLRKTEQGYEIDIANACYAQLSPDWQNENKSAAEVVAKIIESGKQLSRDEIGDIIHNAWLERNSWAKDGELGVPFAKLPKKEQDKDMIQYDVALTMSKAILEKKYINRLEDCAKFLEQAKRDGQNISYEFNGHTLYSEFDTPDTCFLKVCGKTQEERRIADEKWRKEYQEREAKESAEAQAKIPEWKKRGEALIYPKRKENWHKCVEGRANDLYHGSDLVNAMEVMEALEEGKTIKEATKIAEDAGHSGASWGMMMRIVTTFSKQGPAFYRANNKEIKPETEEYLHKLERENRLFESLLSDEKDGPVLGK